MPTKDELQQRVDQLEAENADLRQRVAAGAQAKPNTRPVPTEPSFGLAAGTVADLHQVDKTTDPFTGKAVTRADARERGYDVPEPEKPAKQRDEEPAEPAGGEE